MNALLRAVSGTDLIAYFEFLDDLRESGKTNMLDAPSFLMRRWRGMAPPEARTVSEAWRKTFTHTLPAEDRALNAIEEA